jgi:hypothetical protein
MRNPLNDAGYPVARGFLDSGWCCGLRRLFGNRVQITSAEIEEDINVLDR